MFLLPCLLHIFTRAQVAIIGRFSGGAYSHLQIHTEGRRYGVAWAWRYTLGTLYWLVSSFHVYNMANA